MRIKQNIRHSGKITKPKYVSHKVADIQPKFGILRTQKDKKYKISKIKRPRKIIQESVVPDSSCSDQEEQPNT